MRLEDICYFIALDLYPKDYLFGWPPLAERDNGPILRYLGTLAVRFEGHPGNYGYALYADTGRGFGYLKYPLFALPTCKTHRDIATLIFWTNSCIRWSPAGEMLRFIRGIDCPKEFSRLAIACLECTNHKSEEKENN